MAGNTKAENDTRPPEVEVQSFSDIVQAKDPLRLDEYQRGFVWDSRRVRQLVDHLREYAGSQQPHGYYMGTLLLHRSMADHCFYVIDGQQRVAAVSM